jgi:hypothetical protein
MIIPYRLFMPVIETRDVTAASGITETSIHQYPCTSVKQSPEDSLSVLVDAADGTKLVESVPVLPTTTRQNFTTEDLSVEDAVSLMKQATASADSTLKTLEFASSSDAAGTWSNAK